MSADFAWLTDHSREIYEQYSGKWIAVLDGQIVGVANTATEAAGMADDAHPGADFVLEAVDPEPERV